MFYISQKSYKSKHGLICCHKLLLERNEIRLYCIRYEWRRPKIPTNGCVRMVMNTGNSIMKVSWKKGYECQWLSNKSRSINIINPYTFYTIICWKSLFNTLYHLMFADCSNCYRRIWEICKWNAPFMLLNSSSYLRFDKFLFVLTVWQINLCTTNSSRVKSCYLSTAPKLHGQDYSRIKKPPAHKLKMCLLSWSPKT